MKCALDEVGDAPFVSVEVEYGAADEEKGS